MCAKLAIFAEIDFYVRKNRSFCRAYMYTMTDSPSFVYLYHSHPFSIYIVIIFSLYRNHLLSIYIITIF